jgi:formylmethanofuran dehydrogenase subunit C
LAKDSQIRIKGTYKSLSDEIGEGTEIYQVQNGKWVSVKPLSVYPAARLETEKEPKTSSIDDICKGYEEFMWKDKSGKIPTEITDRYNPTKEQILEFSRALVKFKDLPDFSAHTADYLAALMHSSKDKDFVLDLTELNKTGDVLHFLGHGMKGKSLTITGNAGERVGLEAENSKITVNGNVGHLVGFDAINSDITINGNAKMFAGHSARNSRITVKKNVSPYAGYCAKDSQIIVNGNAGEEVGFEAENSKIYIKGTCKSVSKSIGEGTEIYQEQNGKWVRVNAANSSLEEICKGYQEYMGLSDKGDEIPTEITNRYKPTKEQVLEFSKILIKYKDLAYFTHYTAKYLTALMHSSKDKDFVLDLTELNKTGDALHWLGDGLKGKSLTIIGNAGERVGLEAENSKITVNGNVGHLVGFDAINSDITINGNAGHAVGSYAEDSQITVNGNAGDDVGGSAKNSKIYIKGRYESLSQKIGENTKIYQMRNRKWVRVKPLPVYPKASRKAP